MSSRFYYAVGDTYTGLYGSGYGFINTKVAVVFASKSSRDMYIKETSLPFVRALTRKEAISKFDKFAFAAIPDGSDKLDLSSPISRADFISHRWKIDPRGICMAYTVSQCTRITCNCELWV